MDFSLTRLGLLGLVIGAFFFGLGAPGQASEVGDLSDCSGLSDAIEQSDGSIVAVGNTSSCRSGSDPASPDHQIFLIGLSANGSIRADFGNGGVLLIGAAGDEFGRKVLAAPGRRLFYLVTDQKITPYSPDGVTDGLFGDGGSVVPGRPITGAAIAPDGRIVVSTGTDPRLTTVAVYEPDGRLDVDFGVQGKVELPGIGHAAIAFDSAGRIILAGQTRTARLEPDGALDESFGTSGYVAMSAYMAGYVEDLFEVTPTEGNGLRILGRVTDGLYDHAGFVLALDEDGEPVTVPPARGVGATRPGAMVSFPDGIAFGEGNYREGPPLFAIGTSALDPVKLRISPGTGYVDGITPLADGSLLAVGESGGPECADACEDKRRIAIAKVNPSTGELVKSFGSGGTRMIPANKCAWGAAGQVGDWRRCRVKEPRFDGSARVAGIRGRRPSLAVRSSLGQPPKYMWGTRQQLTLTVPRGIKLRKGGLKNHIKVTVRPRTPFTTQVRTRSVKVKVEPAYQSYDPMSGYGAPASPDPALTIRIDVRRGALSRPAKPAALRRKHLGFSASFVPAPGGMALTQPGNWFAAGSKRGRIGLSGR